MKTKNDQAKKHAPSANPGCPCGPGCTCSPCLCGAGCGCTSPKKSRR